MPDPTPRPTGPTPNDDAEPTRHQERPPPDAGDATEPVTPGPATRLGQYRLLAVLGQGGMGTVWRAEDERLLRPAAVKVMKPELARDPTARERFLREGRAMAAVRSDHVVTVYGAGEDGGVPFLAMELLPGEPLDHWLRQNPRPAVAEVVRIGREAAQGLAAAHARGLIHRDVKPANLWREPTGRVKVLDFGLARPAQDPGLTTTGQLVGTPAYVAPEQAQGKGRAVDHRCDLFSLGTVLYRLCTGQRPFPGETPYEVLASLLVDEPAPVRSLNPDVPEALAALIHRMLAKHPDGRPASADEVVDELRRIETGEAKAAGGLDLPSTTAGWGSVPQKRPEVAAVTPVTAGPRPSRLGGLLKVIAGITTVALLAVGVWWATGQPAPKNGTPVGGGVPPETASVEPKTPVKDEVVKEVPKPPTANVDAAKDVPKPPPMPPEPANDKTLTLDLGGGVTMEFVRVPAGSFRMGSPQAEQDEYRRVTRLAVAGEGEHAVRISRDFYLGKYPVTQEQYQAVTGKNPSHFCATGAGKDKVTGLDTRRFPVESASWEDAVAFCEKLSGRSGKKITLPTEAEWEYACRGGTWTAFYFGPSLNGAQANCDGNHPFGTDARGPYLERTSPVGTYEKAAPHPWGLDDVHGNVLQWCQDRYGEGYYKESPDVDPSGPSTGTERVLRGGSWYDGAGDCRAAVRNRDAPSYRNPRIGFRVALRPE